MRTASILLLTLSTFSLTYSYHVLVVFPIPSKSHTHLGKGIVNALVKAGHEVTFATAYPDQKPMKNVKLIDVSETQSLVANMNMLDKTNNNKMRVVEFAQNITVMSIQNKALRKALTEVNYDAVVTEWFFSDLNAGIAAVQQVPWILLSCTSMNVFTEKIVDEVRSLPIIPSPLTQFSIPMNFYQRLANSFIAGALMIYDQWTSAYRNEIYLEEFTPIAKARGVNLPPFSEAVSNVSILLVNSHPSFVPAQSLPPNTIEVAGYHIDEFVPPLPKDLQEILDNSRNGVVYFSMGSVLRSAGLPQNIRKDLIAMLSEIPYTVLWKFEEQLEGLPKSIHIRPWMPQPSILAHPNVKLFITHGGLLSTMEALHFGVPLLAIPMFGDQPANAQKAVSLGYGLRVDYEDEMAPQLKATLNEMLSNNSYYNMAKHLSMLFRKRPTSPSKLVQFYIELAIETKGAFHLRSKALLYSWYQRWMVDQLVAVLAALYIVYITLKTLLRKLFSKKQKKVGDKVKKN